MVESKPIEVGKQMSVAVAALRAVADGLETMRFVISGVTPDEQKLYESVIADLDEDDESLEEIEASEELIGDSDAFEESLEEKDRRLKTEEALRALDREKQKLQAIAEYERRQVAEQAKSERISGENKPFAGSTYWAHAQAHAPRFYPEGVDPEQVIREQQFDTPLGANSKSSASMDLTTISSIAESLKVDELLAVLFFKYRRLSPEWLLRRKSEIDYLMNRMINHLQNGQVPLSVAEFDKFMEIINEPPTQQFSNVSDPRATERG